MSNDNPFTPAPSLALEDEGQIRAYVHPTRMTILAILAREAQTVTGVARELGVHPANLTHHVKRLEKTGLIRLVEKRDTGRNLEKYYRAVAHSFTVAPTGPADPQAAGLDQAVLALAILRDNLNAAILALKPARRPGPDLPYVLGLLAGARVRPEALEQFTQRLAGLVEEFGHLDDEAGQAYTLNLSLYPAETQALGDGQVRIGGE